MYEYFYNFHNRPLADDLFFRFDEMGAAPPPPTTEFVITDDGLFVTTDDNEFVIAVHKSFALITTFFT